MFENRPVLITCRSNSIFWWPSVALLCPDKQGNLPTFPNILKSLMTNSITTKQGLNVDIEWTNVYSVLDSGQTCGFLPLHILPENYQNASKS